MNKIDNTIDMNKFYLSNLKKLILREIYSHNYKLYSSELATILRANSKIPEKNDFALFNYRVQKNVGINKKPVNFLTHAELKMLMEATENSLYNLKENNYNTRNISDEYREYVHLYNPYFFDHFKRKDFRYINNVNIDEVKRKKLFKAFKQNLYPQILDSFFNTRTDYDEDIINTNKSLEIINPYSEEYYTRFKKFRTDYLDIVKTCKKLNFSDLKISELFLTYDSYFYGFEFLDNRSYILENNIMLQAIV